MTFLRREDNTENKNTKRRNINKTTLTIVTLTLRIEERETEKFV